MSLVLRTIVWSSTFDANRRNSEQSSNCSSSLWSHRQKAYWKQILRWCGEFEESTWPPYETLALCWLPKCVSRQAAHYGRINRGRFSFQDHCIDVGHRLYPNFKDTVLGSSITDDSLQGSLCKDNAMVLPEWWSDKLVEGFNLKENRRFAICHLKTSSLLG